MTETAVIENETAATEEIAAEPKTEQVADVAQSNDRYPDPEVGQALGARLDAAHKAGWTRPKVTELVARVRQLDVEGEGVVYTLAVGDEQGDGFEMGGSALWRSRDGRVHTAEVPYLDAALTAIESGDVKLPAKPTKDAGKLQATVSGLQARLDAVIALGESSANVKGVGALREVLAAVVAHAKGEVTEPESTNDEGDAQSSDDASAK